MSALPQPAPEVAGDELRRAAARFPTGVALVTAPSGDALVVDTFTSVSLDPPLVAFSPSRASLTWRRMRFAGRLAINVLALHHADGLRERARPGADRLRGFEVVHTAYGLPLLADAPAALEVVIEAEHTTGDHTLVVCRVEEIHLGREQPPLVFHGGGFATLA